jgi:hypothetical protein
MANKSSASFDATQFIQYGRKLTYGEMEYFSRQILFFMDRRNDIDSSDIKADKVHGLIEAMFIAWGQMETAFNEGLLPKV